jgi:ABC-type tungstate transport system permease subunit
VREYLDGSYDDRQNRSAAARYLRVCASVEEKLLSDDLGVKRYPVTYNDFVLIGPKSDPAGVKARTSCTANYQSWAPFISRRLR